MNGTRIQDFSLALSAGVPQTLHFGKATSVTMVTATSPVSCKFNNGSSSVTLSAGDGLDEINFEDIELLSSTTQNIVIRLSTGYQRTNQTVNVNASASVEVANTCKALTDVTIGAGLKVLVAAANANRKTLLIKSLSSNTTPIRLGDTATVSATAGNELDAGETAAYDTQAAVYAFNNSASAVTVSLTELEFI